MVWLPPVFGSRALLELASPDHQTRTGPASARHWMGGCSSSSLTNSLLTAPYRRAIAALTLPLTAHWNWARYGEHQSRQSTAAALRTPIPRYWCSQICVDWSLYVIRCRFRIYERNLMDFCDVLGSEISPPVATSMPARCSLDMQGTAARSRIRLWGRPCRHAWEPVWPAAAPAFVSWSAGWFPGRLW